MRGVRNLRIHGVVAAGMCTGLLVGGCGDTDSGKTGKKTVLKLGHTHAISEFSALHGMGVKLKELLDSSDAVDLKLFPASQLGNDRDMIEGMRLGTQDMCLSGTAVYANFYEPIGILDLPYLWDGYDHVHEVLDGEVGDSLRAGIDKLGIRILAFLDSYGFRNVATVKPIEAEGAISPEDLHGLKLRTIESPVFVGAVRLMGANPTPMAMGEIYTALQTHVIDGFEHDAPTIWAGKYYDVVKNIYKTKHIFSVTCLAVSAKKWDKLSEEGKKALTESVKQAQQWHRTEAARRDMAVMDSLSTVGKCTIFDKIDREKFVEATTDFQDEYAEKVGATSLLKRIRR